jgi:fatty acid desaturase
VTAVPDSPPRTASTGPGGIPPLPPGAFQELQRRMRTAGLLDPRPGYYAVKIAVNLALLAAGWAALVRVGDSWWVLAVAAYMAFAYTQTGLIGHDVGHRQVTRNRRAQDLLGLVHGNLLLGFSFGWWVGHHAQHHNHPNHLEKDSNLTRRQSIFVPEQGHSRKGRVRQFLVRHQHVLFYPLMATEGIGLRTESIKAVLRRLPRRNAAEATLIAVHLCAYFGVVFWLLPVAQAIAFIVTMNLLFGLYIGAIFAPNHKGMPIQMPGEEWDWMTRQVVTSRNIRSSYLTDFLYGGLNYQIEHHLFPAMPRASLRKARPITMAYCREIGLPYCEVGVVRSYVEVLRHLYRTTTEYQRSLARADA